MRSPQRWTGGSLAVVLSFALGVALIQAQQPQSPHTPGHQGPGHQEQSGGHRTGSKARSKGGKAGNRSQSNFQESCSGEITRLCPPDKMGGASAIASCLGKNRVKLGASCAKALEHTNRVGAFRRSCGADVKKVCANVTPGENRLISCLKENEASLSETCKTLLSKSKSEGQSTELAAVSEEALDQELAGAEIVSGEVQTAPPEPAQDPNS